MKVFWRQEPLNEHETQLLTLCLEAHRVCAYRENASSAAVLNAAWASGNFEKSMIAAMATIGGTHAPLMETWMALSYQGVERAIEAKKKIPGWGSSFVKGKPDDAWEKVAAYLAEHFRKMTNRIDEVTGKIQAAGKNIFPNASCYTAAVGMVLGMRPEMLAWLFVAGRLNSWSEIFVGVLNNPPSEQA